MSILAPPKIMVSGFSGSWLMIGERAEISFSINSPAYDGSISANPAVELCLLWAVPKASETKMSPSEASSLVKSSWHSFSSL